MIRTPALPLPPLFDVLLERPELSLIELAVADGGELEAAPVARSGPIGGRRCTSSSGRIGPYGLGRHVALGFERVPLRFSQI